MSPHSWKENFSLLRGWKVMAEVRREGRRRKKGSEGLWKKCWWWGGQTGGGKASKTDGGEGVMAVVQEAKRGKTWYEMVVMRRLTCGGLKPLALVYYVSCGVRCGRTDWSHCRTKGVDCPELQSSWLRHQHSAGGNAEKNESKNVDGHLLNCGIESSSISRRDIKLPLFSLWPPSPDRRCI